MWSPQDRHDWFAEDGDRLVRWRETSTGQHLELGIAEINLVVPARRARRHLAHARASRCCRSAPSTTRSSAGRSSRGSSAPTPAASSILVGTPSGVTLAPEGGAHQSITTPSIGLETPGVTAYEPAFAVETEWCLLDALSRLGRPDGESAYLRLSPGRSTRRCAALPADPAALEQRRRDVLAGGYRLRVGRGAPRRSLAVVGALVPEALAPPTGSPASASQADVAW